MDGRPAKEWSFDKNPKWKPARGRIRKGTEPWKVWLFLDLMGCQRPESRDVRESQSKGKINTAKSNSVGICLHLPTPPKTFISLVGTMVIDNIRKMLKGLLEKGCHC